MTVPHQALSGPKSDLDVQRTVPQGPRTAARGSLRAVPRRSICSPCMSQVSYSLSLTGVLRFTVLETLSYILQAAKLKEK